MQGAHGFRRQQSLPIFTPEGNTEIPAGFVRKMAKPHGFALCARRMSHRLLPRILHPRLSTDVGFFYTSQASWDREFLMLLILLIFI